MKKILSVVISGAMLLSVTAQAGENYGSIQYAMLTHEAYDLEANPTALIARFGSYISEDFAIEGRFGFGLQSDSVSYYCGYYCGYADVDVELVTMIGVYGVKHAKLNPTSSVYGMIGFTQGKMTFSDSTDSLSDDTTDLSFGVGADLGDGSNTSFTIEYVQYVSKSDFDTSAISFGMKFPLQ